MSEKEIMAGGAVADGVADAVEAKAKAEQERAERDAADQAEADAAAQGEGFADAKAKADAAAAAAAKPKAPRKPRESKPKSQTAAGIKPEGIEAAVERVATGSHGGFNVRFGNEHGPHRDIPPEAAPACAMQRGRIVTGDRLVLRTRDLSRRTEITHAWLFDGDLALAVRELAAPVNIAPGEQFVIEAGRFAFF